MWGMSKLRMPEAGEALPGRDVELKIAEKHLVLKTPMRGPYPEGAERAILGLGCFWGAERLFWQSPGVITTAAGYSGGFTKNPTYEEVCSGRTGHTEVVQVVFDPKRTS
jgi:peptide-methionine (S)-S-oxide reductase